MSIIVTGDDSSLPVELTDNDKTFPIASSAVIRAAVVSRDRKTIILATVTVLEATLGSDWANSLIIVKFTSAATLAVTRTGKAILEIQVDDNGKQTWFGDIDIVKGTIS